MPEYNISKIAGITGKSLIRDNVIIRLLLTDSRRLISPSDTVFFALEGGRHNGHDYIEDLYTKGVRAFVISETFPTTASCLQS